MRAKFPALVSRYVPLFSLFATLAITACDQTTEPTEDAPEATPPLFLLGGSPLIILLDPTEGAVEVEVAVTRGLVEVKLEDKFKVRMTVAFTVDGTPEGTVGPQDFSLVGVKDDGVRGGGTVALQPCVDIPSDLWSKLVSADEAGATVEATRAFR